MYDSLIDRLIDLAIEEDIATGDITTNAIIPVHAKAVAEMKAKADGVISGLEIAKQVFERFEKDIVWEPLVTDGTAVKKGDIILRIEEQDGEEVYATLEDDDLINAVFSRYLEIVEEEDEDEN